MSMYLNERISKMTQSGDGWGKQSESTTFKEATEERIFRRTN